MCIQMTNNYVIFSIFWHLKVKILNKKIMESLSFHIFVKGV
jgi:hypothetical protein